MSSGSTVVLSVIIVNWNVRDLLDACLTSLGQISLAPEDWEIFVVDNASHDDSASMVKHKHPKASLIANEDNVGFGRANNQAFHLCRGSFILLLNPDTVVLEDAIEKMIGILRNRSNTGAVGCRLLNGDGSYQRWTGGHAPTLANVFCHFLLLYKILPSAMLPPPLYLEKDLDENTEVGWVSGACLLLRREAIGAQIFDESFFLYGEDMDLCERISRKGWKVLYAPGPEIIHYDGRSLAMQSPDCRRNKLKSLRRVFALHNGERWLPYYDLVVAAGFILRSVVVELMWWRRGDPKFASRREQVRVLLAFSWKTLIFGPERADAS